MSGSGPRPRVICLLAWPGEPSHQREKHSGSISYPSCYFETRIAVRPRNGTLTIPARSQARAARQIIGAVRQRRAEVILTPAAQLASRVAGLGSRLTSEVLHLVQRLALPAPPGQAARDGEPVPGHELNAVLPRKAFDRLTPWAGPPRRVSTSDRSYPACPRGIGEFGRPIVCRGRGEG